MGKKKTSKGLIVSIILLTLLVVGLTGYIVYDKVLNSDKEEKNEKSYDLKDSEEKTEETMKFKSYEIGDKIVLTDSSNWNVIEVSTEEDEFVTLLSMNNINDNNSIAFKEATNYMNTTYKNNLITKLGTSSNDIKEIRLLSVDDISKLSGISVKNLIPGTSLENGITPPYLYESETITSSIDKDCPIMICSMDPEYYDTNPGRICIGTQTDKFPIRPVITISKEYIK